MAILLGDAGQVELRRTTQLDQPLESIVNISDVNPGRNRFSFDFDAGVFVSGDRVEIKSTDENILLEWIAASGWPDNKRYGDGIFFLHIDEAGGIKLYNTFSESIAGEMQGIIKLVEPSQAIPIRVTVMQTDMRVLGQIKSFEVNTERDLVDVSSLSKEFKDNYSGLISGNGQITCFFDYQYRKCDPKYECVGPDEIEMPMYMHQLLLRTTVGSEFFAHLTVMRRGTNQASIEDRDDEIWYEFDARATKVAIEFLPGQPMESTINFVATGPIRLRTRYFSSMLLQENEDRMRLESNQRTGDLQLEQDI